MGIIRATAIPALLAGLTAVAPAIAAEPTAFERQRLFTTAEQREHIERMRARVDGEFDNEEELITAAGVVPTDADEVEEPQAAHIPELRLRGFVRRSDGPTAVWVNDDSGLDAHQGRVDGNTVVVTLPDGRSIRLKPGQMYDPERGEVVDGYER